MPANLAVFKAPPAVQELPSYSKDVVFWLLFAGGPEAPPATKFDVWVPALPAGTYLAVGKAPPLAHEPPAAADATVSLDSVWTVNPFISEYLAIG